jgi:putative transposase
VSGRARLALGQWIDFEDERYQITAFTDGGIRLCSRTGRTQLVLPGALIADASFRQADRSATASGMSLDREAVLLGLPEAERQRVLRLEEHLIEADTGHPRPEADAAPRPRTGYDPAATTLSQRMITKASELGVSARWLWHLRAAWQDEGVFGLVDKRKVRLRRWPTGVDERIAQAVREQADAERLDSTASIGGRFRRRTQNRLDAQHGQGVVVLPGADAFRRIVRAVLTLQPDAPASRRIRAANQPERAFGTLSARRPGEVVMMDTTGLDVLAYNPATCDTHPVELTIALDLATRSLLAWRLTPRGTKGIDIGLLLADIMTPEPMRPAWPDALRFAMLNLPVQRLVSIDQRLAHAAARPVVYPETLLFDHGKPYQSTVVSRACQRLGISIQDARVYTPTDRPNVERVFATINQQFCEHVAGYTGADPAHRGRGVEAEARWTIDDLAEFFAEYVIAIYQRQPHQGLLWPGRPDLRASPNEAYTLAIAAAGFADCPTDPDLYYELLPIAGGRGRTIHAFGVQIDRLTYNAEILYRYRQARSPYPGGLWPIRRDPRNLLHAYFHDPADGTWHILRWTHAFETHQPFTDITLREARRLLQQRGQTQPSQEEIATALRELQNRTDAPETWTRTGRTRHARDTHRARAQQRDQQRAAPTANRDHDSAPTQLCNDEEEMNLDSIEAAEIWMPHDTGGDG